jgi:hypothetical protein
MDSKRYNENNDTERDGDYVHQEYDECKRNADDCDEEDAGERKRRKETAQRKEEPRGAPFIHFVLFAIRALGLWFTSHMFVT